jgi:glutamine amidotransferase
VKQEITIVDYGVGNLASIANMLRRIGVGSRIAATREEIADASSVILPGVGSFDGGMRNLLDRDMAGVLATKAFGDRVPVLGLCLGMQLMARSSDEGKLEGLGWIETTCVRFRQQPNTPTLRIPHMGWNAVRMMKQHPLVEGLDVEPRFYFVHAFHLGPVPDGVEVGRAVHGESFPAIVAMDNVMGVQFHPEKSHRFGMTLLRNFASISRPVAA